MKKKIKLGSAVAATLLLTTMACANEAAPKQVLQSNYQLVYTQEPARVDSFTDMFQEGIFYGRLRSNTFMYNWEKESSSQENHYTSGLGGSFVYQSATFNDFDFRTALYYSRGFTNVSADDAANMKPGQDVLSRYNYVNTGSQELMALGQAYISYKGIAKTDVKVGRQLVETFYTKSNDAKMIPNTFDGLVAQTKVLSDTGIKLAYLRAEKLRAHTNAHSVLLYDDSDLANKSIWDANDDIVMHKGLSYTALKAAGKDTDAPLIVGDINDKSIENLSLDASFYVVPELISELMAEANYKVKMGAFSLTPGARYIKQFDNGAGAVGGAAYDGTTTGYKDAESLDSQMLAVRLVTAYEVFQLNLGYSQVFDEADLITPWRGFPTGGYTRSMVRYNWVANTKSYRVKLIINDNKTGVYKDVMIQISALHTDADELKGQFDENYYDAGFVQNIPIMPELQWRFKIGYQDTEMVDADSVDTRFELNYLF